LVPRCAHLSVAWAAAVPWTQCCSWRGGRRSRGSGSAPPAVPPPGPRKSPAENTCIDLRVARTHMKVAATNHRTARTLREREREAKTHEAVALGAAGLAIGDDDGLEYLAVPLEVLAQALGRRLPRQPAHEHLGQRRVAEPRPVVPVRRSSSSARGLGRVGRRALGGR
jgi:hypothetical protein